MNKSMFKYTLSLLLFGLNGILALQIEADTQMLLLLRTLLGTGTILLINLVIKPVQPRKFSKDHLYLLASGMSLGISWLFLFEAYKSLGVGTATLLYYMAPLLVMILAPLLYREPMSLRQLVGLTVILLGMIPLTHQSKEISYHLMDLGLGLGAALFLAATLLLSKKVKGLYGGTRAFWQILGSLLPILMSQLGQTSYLPSLDGKAIFFLLLLGVLNTGIGCYLYFSALPNLPLKTVSILGYLEPLSAVIYGVLFLSEGMTLNKILGTCLILGGALYSQHTPKPGKYRLSPSRFLRA